MTYIYKWNYEAILIKKTVTKINENERNNYIIKELDFYDLKN